MRQLSFKIIGDIAGQYPTFEDLLSKMPEGGLVVGLGDLIDRGPNSADVLTWFRQRPESAIALLGNHELMAIDTIHRLVFQDQNIDIRMQAWLQQGGLQTLSNFHLHEPIQGFRKEEVKEACMAFVERGFYDYLKSLPIAVRHGTLLITHAPALVPAQLSEHFIPHDKIPGIEIIPRESMDQFQLKAFVWNRSNPIYTEGLFQVFGHNSFMGLKRFQNSEGQDFACCIDTSSDLILTGFSWPDRKIYQSKLFDQDSYSKTNL